MRITLIIIVFSVFFAICPTSPAADDRPEPPQRSIVLSAGDGPFVFGRVVSLKVSYLNGGEHPWVFATPTESVSVQLLYRPSGSDRHPQGYSLGRVKTTTVTTPDGKTRTVRLHPRPEPLSIAPGQTYDFRVSFERDWTGDVGPGVWTVWVEDDDEKLESNRLEIPLCFTADSIAACLEIAFDRKRHVSERKEHASWLMKIMPGLKLQWWSIDTPLEKQQQMQAEVQRQLETFQKFWEDRGNDKEVEAAIASINRESGTKR